MKNVDKKTVQDFGEEWEKFNQSEISDTELKKSWDQYFNIFPFDELSDDSEGFDMGCGSGRWARFVAKKGYKINCIDASSKALSVAKKNLSGLGNIKFYNASVNDRVLDEGSQDFGYCLGVLHHIPDTLEGLKACANLLKKDAPFLLYLYYDFENRSYFFKLAWKLSDALRKIISSLPLKTKIFTTTIIAYLIYYPLAKFAYLMDRLGFETTQIPLSDYRNKTFYFMKTDALDRFGTRLEKRFSKEKIHNMLIQAGFKDVVFSENTPFWVCISRKI
tara:strand:- start:645 stop:1472 length:828 start_codon:yes stop_codon:yes gene_type:complete